MSVLFELWKAIYEYSCFFSPPFYKFDLIYSLDISFVGDFHSWRLFPAIFRNEFVAHPFSLFMDFLKRNYGNGLDVTEDKIGLNFSDKCVVSCRPCSREPYKKKEGEKKPHFDGNRLLLFLIYALAASLLEQAFFRFRLSTSMFFYCPSSQFIRKHFWKWWYV